MSTQQKQALKWLVQGLIVVALVCFVLFVFYGPTGKGTESGDSSLVQSHSNHHGSALNVTSINPSL
ncbi:MAG TPA: hypothetical protein VFT51_09420 [Bacillales bacterium]|nr:hypothetical protein [Bacillales bacterium]